MFQHTQRRKDGGVHTNAVEVSALTSEVAELGCRRRNTRALEAAIGSLYTWFGFMKTKLHEERLLTTLKS